MPIPMQIVKVIKNCTDKCNKCLPLTVGWCGAFNFKTPRHKNKLVFRRKVKWSINKTLHFYQNRCLFKRISRFHKKEEKG